MERVGNKIKIVDLNIKLTLVIIDANSLKGMEI